MTDPPATDDEVRDALRKAERDVDDPKATATLRQLRTILGDDESLSDRPRSPATNDVDVSPVSPYPLLFLLTLVGLGLFGVLLLTVLL